MDEGSLHRPVMLCTPLCFIYVGSSFLWLELSLLVMAARHRHQVQAAVATQRDTGSSEEGTGSSRVDNHRKADGEHPDDPAREDGKWMGTEGNKRKTIEEEKESMLRKNREVLENVGDSRGEEGM